MPMDINSAQGIPNSAGYVTLYNWTQRRATLCGRVTETSGGWRRVTTKSSGR